MSARQQNGHVCIAVRKKAAAGATAEEDGVANGDARRYQGEEGTIGSDDGTAKHGSAISVLGSWRIL